MSDRIGVFHQARLEQVGTPQAVYNAPATRFVAHFVGAANVLDGRRGRAAWATRQRDAAAERIRLGDARRRARRRHGARGAYFGAFTRVEGDAQGVLLQADLPDATGAPPPASARRHICTGTTGGWHALTRKERHEPGLALPAGHPGCGRACRTCCTRGRRVAAGLAGAAAAVFGVIYLVRCSRCWRTPSSGSTTSPARWREFTAEELRRACSPRTSTSHGARSRWRVLVTWPAWCWASRWPTTWRATPPARRRRLPVHRGHAAAVSSYLVRLYA